MQKIRFIIKSLIKKSENKCHQFLQTFFSKQKFISLQPYCTITMHHGKNTIYTYINLAIKSCSNLAIKCSYTIDNVKVNCRPKVDFSCKLLLYLYIILFCTLFSQFSTLCASFMNLITILMGPQTSQCTLHWIILK